MTTTTTKKRAAKKATKHTQRERMLDNQYASKDEAEKVSHNQLKVYVTNETRARIEHKAQARGQSVSEFISESVISRMNVMEQIESVNRMPKAPIPKIVKTKDGIKLSDLDEDGFLKEDFDFDENETIEFQKPTVRKKERIKPQEPVQAVSEPPQDVLEDEADPDLELAIKKALNGHACMICGSEMYDIGPWLDPRGNPIFPPRLKTQCSNSNCGHMGVRDDPMQGRR